MRQELDNTVILFQIIPLSPSGWTSECLGPLPDGWGCQSLDDWARHDDHLPGASHQPWASRSSRHGTLITTWATWAPVCVFISSKTVRAVRPGVRTLITATLHTHSRSHQTSAGKLKFNSRYFRDSSHKVLGMKPNWRITSSLSAVSAKKAFVHHKDYVCLFKSRIHSALTLKKNCKAKLKQLFFNVESVSYSMWMY